MPMTQGIAARVEERLSTWLSPKAQVLVAVSGGPDSVALAHLMRKLPYGIHWGHVDHQLRHGSRQDARFVQGLAAEWAVPCDVTKVDVKGYVSRRRLGVEEAARELRYRALAGLARQKGCSAVLTAHTADDQAETVFMNLVRGAGFTGLAGIPPRRELAKNLWLLRPLLTIERGDVMAYLRRHRLRYRQDPTNRDRAFTRNRIRVETFPYLEQHYPGLKRQLVKLADIFREEEGLWERQTRREFVKTVRLNRKTVQVDLRRLLGYHKALGRRILRRVLGAPSFYDLECVYQLARSPRRISSLQLAGGIQVVRKGQKLVVYKENVK